jgi:hypothetical protein
MQITKKVYFYFLFYYYFNLLNLKKNEAPPEPWKPQICNQKNKGEVGEVIN